VAKSRGSEKDKRVRGKQKRIRIQKCEDERLEEFDPNSNGYG